MPYIKLKEALDEAIDKHEATEDDAVIDIQLYFKSKWIQRFLALFNIHWGVQWQVGRLEDGKFSYKKKYTNKK